MWTPDGRWNWEPRGEAARRAERVRTARIIAATPRLTDADFAAMSRLWFVCRAGPSLRSAARRWAALGRRT